jgi:hypothetical protein
MSVKGERLGNSVFSLMGEQEGLIYRAVGNVDQNRLLLSYSATGNASRYTGWSVLRR